MRLLIRLVEEVFQSDLRVFGEADEENGSLGPVDNGENDRQASTTIDRRAEINESDSNSSFRPSTRFESEAK